MRSILALSTLAVAAMMTMSCGQQKPQPGSYNIVGTAEGFSDGDVLYLTTDLSTGEPIDSAVIKGGKFTLTGKSDSVSFALLYSKKMSQLNVPFFLEADKQITLNMVNEPGKSRVSGTDLNTKWQEVNDSMMSYNARIQEYVASQNIKEMDDEMRKIANGYLQNMESTAAEFIVKTAEQNIDNELGFFLVTNYMDTESFSSEIRSKLIEKMPQAMKERPTIKALLAHIAQTAQTEEGKTAPDIKLATPDGATLSLLEEAKKHKLTLVDFWASWCGPCIQNMPEIVNLYTEFQAKGLGIVGVSLDNDKQAWVKAINDLHLTWPQMSDLKGWKSEAAQAYAVNAIPQTFLIDGNGTIVAKGLRGGDLTTFVRNTLK